MTEIIFAEKSRVVHMIVQLQEYIDMARSISRNKPLGGLEKGK
jgi:hypothetical protein